MPRNWQNTGGVANGVIAPNFFLPLNDLGAGAVNTAPVSSGGSATATFTRATAATCWSSAGLLLTVATGVARSNYTELTGANYLGYWAESARTNNCLWNRDFTNAAWVATTMTKALDQVGIDGVTNSASSLLATGANSTVKQTVTIAAVNRPFSVYIKRLTGTGNIDLAQDGATYTTQTVASDGAWHRVTLVASQLNPILSIRLVTSGDKIAVDYAALEDASGGACTFASTPIATTTVAVTRNIDDLNYPVAGNASATVGSVYAEACAESPGNTNAIVNFTSDALFGGLAFARISDGTTNINAIIAGQPITAYTVFKGASSWGAAGLSAVGNGGVVATGAFVGTLPVFTALHIGKTGQGSFTLNGGIKNVLIWGRQLPDAVLQRMTT